MARPAAVCGFFLNFKASKNLLSNYLVEAPQLLLGAVYQLEQVLSSQPARGTHPPATSLSTDPWQAWSRSA